MSLPRPAKEKGLTSSRLSASLASKLAGTRCAPAIELWIRSSAILCVAGMAMPQPQAVWREVVVVVDGELRRVKLNQRSRLRLRFRFR